MEKLHLFQADLFEVFAQIGYELLQISQNSIFDTPIISSKIVRREMLITIKFS